MKVASHTWHSDALIKRQLHTQLWFLKIEPPSDTVGILVCIRVFCDVHTRMELLKTLFSESIIIVKVTGHSD